mgnify:CR=1 FL=1
MRIARFDGGKIGVVDGDSIVDVTAVCGIDPAEWPAVGPLRLIRDLAKPPSLLAPALVSLELEGRILRAPGGLVSRAE